MNVIVVNDFAFVNGGAGKVAIETAKILAGMNNNVVLFTAVGPIDNKLLPIKNLRVICLNQQDILHEKNKLRAMFQGIWNMKAKNAFKELLLQYDQNDTIIHIHALSKALSTSILLQAKRMNFRVVYHLHDYGIACPNMGFFDYQNNKICTDRSLGLRCIFKNCDSRSFCHKVWRVIRQFVQKHYGGLPAAVDCYIYISKFSLDKLKQYIKAEQELVYLPNIVQVSVKERVKAENNKYFIYVGRLSPEKNPELLAKVAKKTGIPVIYVGSGSCDKQIKKICPNANITGWVKPEQIKDYMMQARALVFPSKWYEGKPLSVIEARAYGVPVIASDACAACDEITAGVDGEIFKSNDENSLIESIDILLNPTAAKKYSENCYENYWSQEYGDKEYARRLLKIYQSVLSK